MLARLPRGAYFINVARGEHVVEPDLIEAVRSGHLAGAALDVFPQEPLPADNPIWKQPNVIVTPHVAGVSKNFDAHATELFAANLRRYIDGAAVYNRFDLEKGY